MERSQVSSALFVRNVCGLLGLITCLACAGGSCAGDDEYKPPTFPAPTISAVYPCAALPGDTIRIVGTNLAGASIYAGGAFTTVISNNGSEVIAKVGATASPDTSLLVAVSVSGGESGQSTLKILTGTIVAEHEPNDNINGTDATDTGGERSFGGTLATTIDRDHFRIGCLDPATTYKIKITPIVASPIYVDGRAVVLDSNGEATISSGAMEHVIGLTGGVGTYTGTLTPQ